MCQCHLRERVDFRRKDYLERQLDRPVSDHQAAKLYWREGSPSHAPFTNPHFGIIENFGYSTLKKAPKLIDGNRSI